MKNELQEKIVELIEGVGMEKASKILKKHLKGYKTTYIKSKLQGKLYFSSKEDISIDNRINN